MRKYLFVLVLFCLYYSVNSQAYGIKLKDTSTFKFDIHSKDKFLNKAKLNTPKSLVFQSPFDYYETLGFMCKWELKINSKIKNPIRLRLGSYDYVNRLEGK